MDKERKCCEVGYDDESDSQTLRLVLAKFVRTIVFRAEKKIISNQTGIINNGFKYGKHLTEL